MSSIRDNLSGVAGASAELALKNAKAFNEEITLLSKHLGHVTFCLVLAVQCLVFVVGVLTLAVSLVRSALFLLSGVDSTLRVMLCVDSVDFQTSDNTHCVDEVVSPTPVERHHERPSEEQSPDYPTSLSNSDTLSLTRLRMFSETKV